ncbi:MAG: ATP-binding domain-containing protein [Janthinobacterium lividum]
MTVRLDGKTDRTITFDPDKVRGLDYGYAVTSHSSQGLTERRVIANMDTETSRNLINTRLAYVAISRAETDARIYTNDAANLGKKLASDISKTAAVDFRPKSQAEEARDTAKEFKEKPSAAKETIQEQRKVYEYAHPDYRLAAVATDYAARPDRAVVLAGDPAERKELTQLIRIDLHAQGRLTGESRSVPVLVERELANPKLAGQYAPGDQIHYKVGSPQQHGIASGSTAIVLKVDRLQNLLTVETGSGESIAYRPHELKGVTARSTVYREETRELAVGERIQFTEALQEPGHPFRRLRHR